MREAAGRTPAAPTASVTPADSAAPRDVPSAVSVPAVGKVVRDTERDRLGRVMGHEGPYVQVRPLGGGREWDADSGRLLPLTGQELLSALVAEANARSRRPG